MSINSVSGNPNWWNWQSQAAQASSGSAATGSTTAITTGDSIANTGTVAAASNLSTFLQAFSADLQAMLVQTANAAGTTGATQAATGGTGTQASSTSQIDPNQPQQGVHHHHHHHGGGDEGGSMQTAANQLVGNIGQTLQNGTLTSNGISNTASAFAADVMQALQSYGTTMPTASGPALLA